MLTIKLISEETERVIKGLEKKHFKGAREAVENVLAVDKRRREAQQKSDKNKQEIKQLSSKIGSLMKEGRKDEAEEIKTKVAVLKQADKTLGEEMAAAEKEMETLLCSIPNIPNDDVPEGAGAEDNVVVKTGGEVPEFEEEPLCHWDLCKKFNLIDFDLGVKITGAGFPYISEKWLVCSVRLKRSSSKRHARADISKFSRPTW